MHRYCYRIFIFFMLVAYTGFSQTGGMSELKLLGDSVFKGSTDSVRISSSDRIHTILKTLLSDPGSFSENFDSIKVLSTIYAPDKKFRFYQWAFPLMETNSYRLFGYLQVYDAKKKTVTVFELKDSGLDKYEAMNQKLTPGKCFNAVYYKIVPVKYKRKNYYTLLGWRGNNLLTTMKVIDVLTFENNAPVFGARLFNASNYQLSYGEISRKYRIIFEFNAQASMSLRYEPRMKMIVYDHLSASKSSLKGMEQFMGPDFTYDGFKWKKGKWTGKTNLEMKNNTSQTKKDFQLLKDADLK